MNAVEIIKDIIAEGINQCKEPLWERLLLPEFDVPNPKNDLVLFNTPEEWSAAEMRKLAIEDQYFEKEYYASEPLMREEEYSVTNFSQNYKDYVPDYFEYNKKWHIDNEKLVDIEKTRNEFNLILEHDFLSRGKFFSRRLSERTLTRIHDSFGKAYFLKLNQSDIYYKAYTEIWGKAQTKEGKQNIIKECESRWFFDFHGHFYWRHIMDLRLRESEIKLNYNNKWEELTEEQKNRCQEWEEKRNNYQIIQEKRKKEIEDIRIEYLRMKPDSIIIFCKEVLKYSKYNFEFDKNIEIDFNPETKILIFEYNLPTIENLPNIKLFDEAVHSITLRSIYEIFINDKSNVVNAINFNGWIRSINKATGKQENNCIVSIQVQRDDFMDIELLNVESKSCFKFFKGVGSSKLYGITAIQPILQIQKNDKRFVSSQNVEIDNSTNLAAMDWEDFEHLIRELFEKEFSSNGGEVKVTQASRDGGVDAIAFDPDPIRGGKIVIQAKRYTNTVGVAAVRDLFGTVMNEEANKGILVTTSDYGPDSYEFAKGKPLTLLNGANLLLSSGKTRNPCKN